MADNQGLPLFKKNALDERRLSLYAKKQEGAKGAPKMSVSVTINQPRFTVFTNDANNTILRAKMDSPTFIAVINEILELPLREPGHITTWTNMTGQPSNMVEDSRLSVGKNNQGVCFITVYKNDGGDRIVFPFLPSMYHKVSDNNGEIQPPELSNRYATAWGKLLLELVPNVLNSEYVEQAPHQQGNGGGNRGGGGNNYGNRGGGGSRNNKPRPPAAPDPNGSDFDDFDGLPM